MVLRILFWPFSDKNKDYFSFILKNNINDKMITKLKYIEN